MPNFVKFLGTAGARVVLSKQLRSSGGISISLDETNLHIDPGPGALVHSCQADPPLDPSELDGILLSHKHIDHSGDINVMIEAMTDGTFKKKGIVIAPREALEDDPVILKYIRKYPEKIEIIEVGKEFQIKNLKIVSPIKNIHHSTETYGFKIIGRDKTISYIPDTRFFEGLSLAYAGSDVLIINVLLKEKMHIDHLTLAEAQEIVKTAKPKVAIFTHFGFGLLQSEPKSLVARISKETGIQVIAAFDGLQYDV